MYKPINLTKKTAQKLISQVLPGVKIRSGGKLDSGAVIFTAYTAPVFALKVTCENDWFYHNKRIRLTIHDPLSGSTIFQYFHPDTLTRDYFVEESERRETVKNAIENWVQSIGPEKAHKLIDQYWEGR